MRQLPTFFVSSVHGHPTSALAKVTSTRSICCSYFWATCRPLFTSDASANCSPKYLLVTLKYCGRHHSSGSRVWSHISHGMMEIKLRWMRMIVSGLWGGNSRWHHSVDHPRPYFLYFHFFLCLCICQVTTWCNCVFVYVCSCIFHICVFLLVSHEMYLFFRPHWAGGCVIVFVDIFLSLCFCISLYWCKCQVAPWCRPPWAGGNTEVTARSRRQCWSCSWWGLCGF